MTDTVPCLWFNKNAEEAAKFYAASAMDAMMTMKKIDIARIEAARVGDARAVRPASAAV
jgi:predicted 3-demethylubiquinone-9 3-methyltransferase (glyoxalase superfamily)